MSSLKITTLFAAMLLANAASAKDNDNNKNQPPGHGSTPHGGGAPAGGGHNAGPPAGGGHSGGPPAGGGNGSGHGTAPGGSQAIHTQGSNNAVHSQATGNPALSQHSNVNASHAGSLTNSVHAPAGGPVRTAPSSTLTSHSAATVHNNAVNTGGQSAIHSGNNPNIGHTATNATTLHATGGGAASVAHGGPAATAVGAGRPNAAGGTPAVSQINSDRSHLQGFNSKPLPAGQVSRQANGAYTLHTNAGNQLGVRQNGTVASFAGHGQRASFAPNGHVAAVHTSTMDIHSVHGARVITSQRPDHSLLVSTGAHRGYIERPYVHGGHAFVERRYAFGGHVYNRFFYPYRYHGLLLAGAIAAYYYAPHFYGWAYDPWSAPVAYRWGWTGAPWYGYYNGYFTPSVSYVDGAAWLTDYSLSEDLAAAYDDQGGAAPPAPESGELGAVYSDAPSDDYIAAPAATPITPELKAAIAQEVRKQLADEKAAAANPNDVAQTAQLQAALEPSHVFLVSTNLNASTVDHHTCALTPGDALQLQQIPSETESSAVLRVASTKRGDCPADARVQLTLQNLQDMDNDLRIHVDNGLASLQENQGKNGLPPAPGDALAAPRAPVADDGSGAADVQALLDEQRKQADQIESDVSQSALSGQ